MSTAIVYYSQHHGNTKKLLDAIKEYDPDVKLIDTTKTKVEDLSSYDRIGIASGIYFGKFNKDLTEYIKNALPHAIKVFGIYTCGNPSDKYTKEIRSIVNEKGCKWIGEYGSLGFDTFGPFKLVGGMAKDHPTDEEIAGAVHFYETLI